MIIRRPKAAIWLALVIALVVHSVLILMPTIKQLTPPVRQASQIEIQVQYEERPTDSELPPEPVTEQIAITKTPPAPTEKPLSEPAKIEVNDPSSVSERPNIQTVPAKDRPDNLNNTDTSQLSRTILSRQFISEPSVTDKIFGPAVQEPPAEAKTFHFPLKPNMMTMLDRPIPNLPFEYTPDLVHFAYDPGVKGDLQRFWDKITPEFGWRTKYGTEVKCVWVLVIAGCAWGRSK